MYASAASRHSSTNGFSSGYLRRIYSIAASLQSSGIVVVPVGKHMPPNDVETLGILLLGFASYWLLCMAAR